MLQTITSYGFRIVGIYLIVTITLASIVAVYQEYKIWKHKSLPSLNGIGAIRVFLFNVSWMTLCFLGSIWITVRYIITFGTTNISKEGNCIVERIVARFCMQWFGGPVDIIGTEHLPSPDQVPAPVYIANHHSQLDIGAVYYMNRRIKWIAKQSVLYIPGVGQIMYLSQHVLIKRTGDNKNSVSNLFEKSDESIQAGIPMFVFPQGTRYIAKRLPFKNGAFIIAQKNCTPLVPISIYIPTTSNPWNTLYPFHYLVGGGTQPPRIQLTIHPIVPVTGKENIDELKEVCAKIIYSVLPTITMEEEKDQ